MGRSYSSAARQIGVIGRDVGRDQRLDRHRPVRIPPFADLAHGFLGNAGRGNDQALQPVRELPAEISDVAVVGARHRDLESRVVEPDEAHERAGDQEMHIRPLVVHVLDAVGGVGVLHPGARHLAAAPARLAAGEGLARHRLAEHAAIEFPAEAVGVQTVASVMAIRGQLSEPRPKARVEIALEDLCGRTDMRVGIINAKAVSHGGSPRCVCGIRPV
jgi:hypothetical protein